MVDQKEQDIIITTCCHTVNTLIQRYYPQAIPYMAHTLSPMLAHAKYIKERHPGYCQPQLGAGQSLFRVYRSRPRPHRYS